MNTTFLPEHASLPARANGQVQRAQRAWPKTALAAALLAGLTLAPTPCRADNPIVQTSYTADPAPVVYGDTLWLYTSHDEDVTVSNFYTMNDWRVYSTVDMVNWTDHGSPGGYKSFSWGTDNAWAPQGISRNGKYYLFVPLNNNTGAKIGVGVADTPIGPFKDPLNKALAASGSGNIDPTVFIDDDNQAYMYWGNGTLRYVKLNTDMTSYSGSVTNVSLSGFVEGPWFYKRQSLYYMVYAASGGGNEKLSYATSNSPTGPWTTKGDIIPSGSTYTNHPGVIDYKGHSYFFYHNSALPGGSNYKRSVCVEEFTYGSDGSIPKVTPSSEGPAAVANLNPFQQVEAETIAFSAGLKTEACTDTGGGMDVTSISNGDYIKVKGVDFLDGVTSFDARVSSAASNAKIELHLDSQSGTSLGTCDVSGASSWTTKTCTVTGGSGKHDLFLKFTGGSGDLFKFNWWKFSGPNTGGTGGAGGMGGMGNVAGAGGAAGGSGAAAGGSAGHGSDTGGRGGATGSGGALVAGNGGREALGGGSGSGGSVSGSGGAVVSGGSAGATGGQATGATGGSVTANGGTGAVAGRSNTGVGGALATGGSTNGDETGDATSDGSNSCGCRQGGRSGDHGLAKSAWLVAACLLLVRRRRAA